LSAGFANRQFVPADTSVDAYEVQVEALRRMSGAERCAIVFRLNEFARRVSETGIRQRHPEYDDERVRKALLRLRLGDTLMRTIWPNDELVEL
jgi:hypothetical protein